MPVSGSPPSLGRTALHAGLAVAKLLPFVTIHSMRLVIVVCAAWLALSGLPASAQGPDEQYIGIYAMIQEADTLLQSGQTRTAVARFTDAQTRLKRLQTAYPDWNPRIVSFRLNYIATRLASAAAKMPDLAITEAASGPKPEPAAKPGDASPELLHELQSLRSRVGQLESDNQLLQAKLKEALTAQPAVLDPRELAKAEERVRSLEKETDLLKVALEAERKRKAAPTDSASAKRLREQLAEARRKLAEQTDLAKSLAQDKARLQQRLEAKASAEAGELAQAAERIKALEKEAGELRASLEQVRSQPAATASPELDRLKQSLAEANRRLAEQTDLAKALAEEKAEIARRVDTLTAAAAAPTAELAQTKQALAEANRRLTEQTELAKTLAEEKAEIAKRLETQTATAASPSAELTRTREALAEANRRLAEQTQTARRLTDEQATLQQRLQTLAAEAETAAALRAENALLKKQAAELQATAGKSTADQELQKARAQIAALQSDLEVLRTEKSALENRVRSSPAASAPAVAASGLADAGRLAELEKQRDDLQKRLDSALREVLRGKTEAGSKQASDTARQLAALRARIEVLEARPVPFTPEELALMKRPEPRLAVAETKPAEKPGEKSAAPPSASTVTLTAEAQRSFAARQYDQAEANFQQVLRQDNASVTTLANLAITQMELNRLEEAERHAQQAVAVAPNHALGHSVLGQVRSRQGKYDEAVDELSRAAQLNPQSAEIQNHLGIALSHKGLRVPAERALRKAIQLEPGYGSAHNNLAVIYLNQQPPMVELARWHYQKALAAGHPKNPELEIALEAKKAP